MSCFVFFSVLSCYSYCQVARWFYYVLSYSEMNETQNRPQWNISFRLKIKETWSANTSKVSRKFGPLSIWNIWLLSFFIIREFIYLLRNTGSIFNISNCLLHRLNNYNTQILPKELVKSTYDNVALTTGSN